MTGEFVSYTVDCLIKIGLITYDEEKHLRIGFDYFQYNLNDLLLFLKRSIIHYTDFNILQIPGPPGPPGPQGIEF